MKVIYRFDNNNIFTGSDLIEDNAVLPSNSTLVPISGSPKDPVRWNGNEWLAATDEEHEEYHKNDPVEEAQASSQDKINATLIKQDIAIMQRLQSLEGATK